MPTLPDEAPGLPNPAVEAGRELHELECVIAVTILAPSHTHVAVDANDTDAAATGRRASCVTDVNAFRWPLHACRWRRR